MSKSKAELQRLSMNAKMQHEMMKHYTSNQSLTALNKATSPQNSGDVIEPAGEIDYSKYVRKAKK